jgi:flagellar M-ring protein FliF
MMKRASKEYRVADISLKNPLKYISVFWSKLVVIQKIIFIGIILAVIVSLVALHTLTWTYSLTPVIDAPIRDETILDRIVLRINQEGVKIFVSPEGLVQVADETTARRMRAILIREDLIPRNIDPWAIFDRERWTITDFERNINFRRAQTQMITDHIKAIESIDDANVVVIWPERELFHSDQKPITASVIITPKSGSDIFKNRKEIEAIQRILKLAIDGLDDGNIVITDQAGNLLNYFE